MRVDGGGWGWVGTKSEPKKGNLGWSAQEPLCFSIFQVLCKCRVCRTEETTESAGWANKSVGALNF